eukprot:gene19435-26093_t
MQAITRNVFQRAGGMVQTAITGLETCGKQLERTGQKLPGIAGIAGKQAKQARTGQPKRGQNARHVNPGPPWPWSALRFSDQGGGSLAPSIDDIPEQLVVAILSYLPFPANLHSQAVCKRWKSIQLDPALGGMVSHVAPGGSIVEAIQRARPGSTIVIPPGFHQEPILLEKPLKLVASSALKEPILSHSSASTSRAGFNTHFKHGASFNTHFKQGASTSHAALNGPLQQQDSTSAGLCNRNLQHDEGTLTGVGPSHRPQAANDWESAGPSHRPRAANAWESAGPSHRPQAATTTLGSAGPSHPPMAASASRPTSHALCGSSAMEHVTTLYSPRPPLALANHRACFIGFELHTGPSSQIDSPVDRKLGITWDDMTAAVTVGSGLLTMYKCQIRYCSMALNLATTSSLWMTRCRLLANRLASKNLAFYHESSAHVRRLMAAAALGTFGTDRHSTC